MRACFLFVAMGGLLVAAAPSLAQERVDSGTIRAHRTFQTSRAVVDSSFRYFPRINDRFLERRKNGPENPPPPIALVPPTGQSLVEVGRNSFYTRVAAKRTYPGISATGWNPPDPNLAVGPNHVVQVVNCSVAWFNKSTGEKLFQQEINGASGWFGTVGAGDFVFDPKCFYDPVSQRFLVLGLEFDDPTVSKLCIAVSDDNNPEGNWFKYRVEAQLTVGSNNYWMDYPSYGANKDALVVCGNMFPMAGSGGWGGVQFVVMRKAPMLTGAATTVTSLVDPNSGSAQVAQTPDTNLDRIYGATVDSTSNLRVYAITSLLTTPQLSFTSVPIPSFSPIRRNGLSTNARDFWTVDSRLFNVVWRSGRLLTTHHVSWSDSDSRHIVRWYDIATRNYPSGSDTPLATQVGEIRGGAGQDYHFPAINMNRNGDISLIFSRSSTAITADVMVASRKSSDPAGTVSQPKMIVTSQNPNYGSAGSNRWGDYFSVQVDPNDDRTFWGTSMYSNAQGGWTTNIDSWIISNFFEAATGLDASAVFLMEGLSSTGTVNDLWSNDGNAYVVTSRFNQRLGHVASIETHSTLPGPVSALEGLGVRVKAIPTVKLTGFVSLWNWTRGGWESVWSVPLSPDTSLPPVALQVRGDLSRFVSSTGQVRLGFRAVSPVRKGAAFTIRNDQVQVLAAFRPE